MSKAIVEVETRKIPCEALVKALVTLFDSIYWTNIKAELWTQFQEPDAHVKVNVKPVPEEVKITYRGWPGHYILCDKCIFHLNTLIEYKDLKVVVSTVGNLRQEDLHTHQVKRDTVGNGRYYETMVFHAALRDGYWENDVTNQIQLSTSRKWCVDHIDWESDHEAQKIHEDTVTTVVEALREGRIQKPVGPQEPI